MENSNTYQSSKWCMFITMNVYGINLFKVILKLIIFLKLIKKFKLLDSIIQIYI